MSRVFHNLLPEGLLSEQKAARRADVVPVEAPGLAFETLATEGEPMIYVVAAGRLVVSKRRAMGENVSHAVLAGGGPVQAAGEFAVSAAGGTLVVTALNNMSGHYLPDVDSLSVARRAFETWGVPVRPGVIRSYDWRSL